MIEIKQIQFLSPEYWDMLSLRSKILREPLGLSFGGEDILKDKRDYLLGAFYSSGIQLVGCCILTPISDSVMQLRQMAVDDFMQKRGVGSILLDHVELLAVNQGYNYIYLHARKLAVDFYRKQGYAIDSGEFTEVGIPHFEMLRILK